MKKVFLSMGLALAAIILTNCAKEAEGVKPAGKGFTISAYDAATDISRTVLDPSTHAVTWTDSDNLGVFCVEAGTTPATWTATKFVASNPAANEFSNATFTIDPAKHYDWYVMSPYNTFVSDPKGTSGTFRIGNQTQKGATTDHLTAVDAMVGVVKNVQGKPSVSLKHVGTLMKFTITNTQDDPITPASITFTPPSGTVIAGQFPIYFETAMLGTAAPAYTNTKLTINNAPTLAKNETFDAYMMMVPFALNVGEKFTIEIETKEGQTCTLEKTIEGAAIAFAPGKVNTATLPFVADVISYQDVTGDWSASLYGFASEIYTGSANNATALPIPVINGLAWNANYTWTDTGQYLSKQGGTASAIVIGSGARPIKELVWSTQYYKSPVSKIIVNTKAGSSASSTKLTYSVSVGGVDMKCTSGNAVNTVTNSSLTDVVFEPDGVASLSGEIVIKVTNSANGGLWLGSLSITAAAIQ